MDTISLPPEYTPVATSSSEDQRLERTIPILDNKPDLVVAIDFGTTFTGVAYLHTSLYKDSTWKVHEIAERITVLQRWPNASQAFAEKIPTTIAYNASGQPLTWGASVGKQHKDKVQYFKLGLQRGAARHYSQGSSAASEILGGFLTDTEWRHPKFPDKSPVDFTADYLTCVHRYFTEDYLTTQYGPVFLKGQRLGYVITVPAIWTEKAKDLTRQAAVLAGIDDSSLVFITEPEAAALYCATICKEVGLEGGDRFIVCDAGGGTVV
jgi:molecular chaperone DnaK (HSP70)